MITWHRPLMVAVLIASMGAGCAHPGRCRSGRCPTIEDLLPQVARGTLVPDTDAVKSLGDVEQVLAAIPMGDVRYFALSAEDCQCRAAAQSSIGNLLDAERRMALKKHHPSQADLLRADILGAAAQEARNKTAGIALELYWSLAEAEARLDLVKRSDAELQSDLHKTRQLREQGMQIPFDESEIERQRNQLATTRIEIELDLAKGNHYLRRLLALRTDDPQVRIWPTTPLAVVVEVIDPSEEVAQGLCLRPELRLLRRVSSSINIFSLPIARDMLKSINGLLGGTSEECCRVKKVVHQMLAAPFETVARRRQMAAYTAQRELEVTEEIREQVIEIDARLREIAIAKQTAASLAEHIRVLQGQSERGKSTFLEISTARVKQFDAEGEVIRAVAAWAKARTKLKELEGLLIAECCGCVSRTGVGALPAIRALEPIPAGPISVPPSTPVEAAPPLPAVSAKADSDAMPKPLPALPPEAVGPLLETETPRYTK